MACVELPKDATGREIPLDTKLLYDKEGNPKEVLIFTYAPRSYSSGWNVVLAGGFERFASAMFLNPPEPPDSWEKLEEDLDRCIKADSLCEYDPSDECSTCVLPRESQCRCDSLALEDIKKRIRKLRGEDE